MSTNLRTQPGAEVERDQARGAGTDRGTEIARQRHSEGKRAERRLGLLLCAPAVITMLAVTAYPILYAFWLSLQRADLRTPDQNEFIGLENYVTVLSSPIWWDAFGITMLITVVSAALELVFGMMLAIVMHRTIVGRGLVRTSALVPYAIVTVVATILRREGYDVLEASSGPECIALVDRGQIDLVLLDVTMPEMDGFAVCQALRMREAGRQLPLPIVLLTGRTDLDARVEGMHHGVSEFLTKPVNRHELVARVRAQLRIVSLTRELETIERTLRSDQPRTPPQH